MFRRQFQVLIGCVSVAMVISVRAGEPDRPAIAPPANSGEARARATLLHEMVRGSLQVMHRDFFDEDNAHAIPSASLVDVFHEMGRTYDVEMKWLVVNTDIVNVDNQPETEFDAFAVKALASGKPYAERAADDRYHFAGPIRMGSQCLKCHVKRRTSNEDPDCRTRHHHAAVELKSFR